VCYTVVTTVWCLVHGGAGGHRPGGSQPHHHVFDAAGVSSVRQLPLPLPLPLPVGAPRKKARTTFTRTQLAQLEDSFRRQKYLAAAERAAVAARLNITDAQVKMWFQNRRTKWRYGYTVYIRRFHAPTLGERGGMSRRVCHGRCTSK